MLVLERKPDDRIVIGDGVEIVVVKVRGERVWLGVRAPSDVEVLRHVLQRRMPRGTADVEIVVAKVRADMVWLGIDTPPDVKVLADRGRGRGRRREGGGS